MTRRHQALQIAIFSCSVALAACAGGVPTAQSQADAETQSACRERAEQAYEQQNRAEIYSPQSQVNTPYSAGYAPAVYDRNLSQLFAHDRMVSDCVRNTGTGTERSPPPTPPH